MATLTVKLETQQALDLVNGFKSLTDAVTALSDNVAKWQSQQVEATTKGFAALVAVFGDEEIQQRVNQLTQDLRTSTDTLDAAVKQYQPNEGE